VSSIVGDYQVHYLDIMSETISSCDRDVLEL